MSLTQEEYSQIILMIDEEDLNIEVIATDSSSCELVLKLNDFEGLDRIKSKITELSGLKNPEERILCREAPGIPSPRTGRSSSQAWYADIILILDFEFADCRQIKSDSDSDPSENAIAGGWRRPNIHSSGLIRNNFFRDQTGVLTSEKMKPATLSSNQVTDLVYRDKSI